MPHLAFNLNDGNEFVFNLLEDRLSIGRDARNDIVIDNGFMSGFHAELVRHPDGGYELVDLQSSNGTFVNGQRIQRARVNGGEKIRFGQLDARFRDRPSKSLVQGANARGAQASASNSTPSRRGDTESVPTRSSPPPASGTSPVGMVKPLLGRIEANGKGRIVPRLPGSALPRPIAAPDPSFGAQAEQLHKEIAALKQERDQLRADNDKETRLREELRVLDQQLEAQKRPSTEGQAKLTGLKEQLAESAGKSAGLAATQDELQKAGEAHKAEMTSAIAQLTQERDVLSRAVVADAEKGKAQHLLTQALAARRAAVEGELRQLDEQQAELSQKLAGAQESLVATEEKLEQRRQEIAVVEQRATDLQAQAEAAEKQRQDLSSELRELESRIVAAKAQSAGSSAAAAAERKAADDAAADHEKQTALAAGLQDRIAELQSALATLTTAQTEAQQHLSSLNAEQGSAASRLAAAQQELPVAEARVAELAQQKAALENQVAELEAKASELAPASRQLDEARSALAGTVAEREKIDGEVRGLAATREEHERTLAQVNGELTAARAALEEVTREKDAAAEALAKSIEERHAANEAASALLSGIADLDKLHEEKRIGLEAAIREHERAANDAARLAADSEEQKRTLVQLASEANTLREHLAELIRDKQAAAEGLTATAAETQKLSEAASAFRAEAAELDNLLRDKRAGFEAEVQARIARIADADAELRSLTNRVAAAEKRAQELGDVEKHLANVVQGVKDAEAQRLTEEITLAELARQQETLREAVAGLETQREGAAQDVAQLNASAESFNGRTAQLQQQIAHLEEALRSKEERLAEFTNIGGKVLDLGAALAALEARHAGCSRSLRAAAESELAMQVQLSAVQETLNREMARVEHVKADRAAADAEFKTFTAKLRKEATALQASEAEQKQRIAELEKRGAEMERRLRNEAVFGERLNVEVCALEERKAEFAEAQAQLQKWREIENRLQGQLMELEEKHELLRQGLPRDDETVVMFANDLIKRIDLIDALIAKYAAIHGTDVAGQLATLRASFEDILYQHGVAEFDVPAGTEVDLELRKRITIMDSVPGQAKTRVVELLRSGFVYSREDGHEMILRKVEVRTSSQ